MLLHRGQHKSRKPRNEATNKGNAEKQACHCKWYLARSVRALNEAALSRLCAGAQRTHFRKVCNMLAIKRALFEFALANTSSRPSTCRSYQDDIIGEPWRIQVFVAAQSQHQKEMKQRTASQQSNTHDLTLSHICTLRRERTCCKCATSSNACIHPPAAEGFGINAVGTDADCTDGKK